MEGLPRAKRGERDYLNALTYSVQSPPFVVRDLIITPASISSLIIKKEQIPGYIRAFDARTGKVRWTFKTVPTPGEFGNDSWESDSWSYAGKVTVWSTMSADEELGPAVSADQYRRARLLRRPSARATTCLPRASCASISTTGTRVWHFQTVHHGLWDYDNPTAPNLLDITVNGTRVKALAQITKQGFVYTLNRETGVPIWPIEERPVPPSDIPGEKASPTQPFPTRPAAFERQGVTTDDLADFTPEIRAMALEAIKPFKIGPLFTPPTLQGTIMQPGASGGGNWSGAAVDRETGMLFVPVETGVERHPARSVAAGQPGRQSELPAGHAAQPEHARRPAAAQAAVLADHGDQHEHRGTCVDDAGRQRRSLPQSAAAEAAQSSAARRRPQHGRIDRENIRHSCKS